MIEWWKQTAKQDISLIGKQMRKKRVAFAVAQMRESGRIAENLRQIEKFAAEARAVKADILCFPECALTGYGPVYHKSPLDVDAGEVESALAGVRRMAREMRMAIVLGAPLPLEGGWSNSALLLRPDGRIAARYDKAHLYGRDAEFYRAGRATAQAARTKRVCVGMQICFDLRFPEPFRQLSLAGAQVIVVPSHIHAKKDMWKGPVMASHVSSRAAENGRFVVFINAAGVSAQNVPSMIANPRGEIIARCRKGVGQLLVAKLDLRAVNDDFLSCRRTDMY